MSSSKTKLIIRLHNLLNVGVVIAVTYCMYLQLLPLAIVIALSSKWRILNPNPHRLLRSLRANACDLIVITSTVLLMDIYRVPSGSLIPLFLLAGFLLLWLLVIKPRETPAASIAQAACCQTLGLGALWLYGVTSNEIPSVIAIMIGAIIGGVSARHALQFYDAKTAGYDLRSTVTFVWALLVAQLSWLAWTWSISYQLYSLIIPQIVILTTFVGYFAVQTVNQNPRASKATRQQLALRQLLFFGLLVSAIMVLTPWVDV